MSSNPGTLDQVYQVSNSGTWSETVNMWVGSKTFPEDLTGCTASLVMLPPPGSVGISSFTLNAANGRLTIVSNRLIILVSPSDMGGVAPGDYPANIHITYPNGFVDWVLTFIVRVVAS